MSRALEGRSAARRGAPRCPRPAWLAVVGASVAAVGAALALGAAPGKPAGAEAAPATPSPAGVPASPRPSPGAAGPTASPSPGGAAVAELRIPFPQDDGSLTPYTFELGYSLMTLVYDTLMWRDADGEPQPWLAESVERSADGRRVTVRLAADARWHDGQPVTAEDVAFTFDYVAGHYHPRFTPQLDAVERVEVTGEHTAVIHLAHPSPGFLDQPLADVPILPAHRWRDRPESQPTPDGLPVGSGPYELAAYEPGEAYRFVADADYFRGAPAVGEVSVPIIDEATGILRALEGGEVDMLPLPLAGELAHRVDGLGVDLLEGPLYVGTELRFNTRRPPFDQRAVRRAVARAIDLDRVASAIGADAVPARRGYIHPVSSWAATRRLHTADPDAARQDLAAFDLPALTVLAPDNDPVKKEAARQVAAALRRAGVDAESEAQPPDEHADALGIDGGAPTFRLAVASGFPLASHDPDFLQQVFTPKGGRSLSRTGYDSQALAAATDRIGRATDRDQRQAAVDRALAILAEDLPVLPLAFPDGEFAYRSRVYDRWVFVRGSGPLDKRSLLGDADSAATPSDSPSPSGRGNPGKSSPSTVVPDAGAEAQRGIPIPDVPVAVVVVGILALGVVVLGLMVMWLARRRR